MQFYLCTICGRTFLESCNYDDSCVLTECDGLPGDLITWDMARATHPELPETPLPRVSYAVRNGQELILI